MDGSVTSTCCGSPVVCVAILGCVVGRIIGGSVTFVCCRSPVVCVAVLEIAVSTRFWRVVLILQYHLRDYCVTLVISTLLFINIVFVFRRCGRSHALFVLVTVNNKWSIGSAYSSDGSDRCCRPSSVATGSEPLRMAGWERLLPFFFLDAIGSSKYKRHNPKAYWGLGEAIGYFGYPDKLESSPVTSLTLSLLVCMHKCSRCQESLSLPVIYVVS